jgi:7-carboxy-7-deazaguanine synthase
MYRVKEIFYTLQGEGRWAGRPAVFLRFTGCNLWTGHEPDRHRPGAGSCARWCDTDFVGQGPDGGRYPTAEALVAAVAAKWPADVLGRPYVVCTGGEPALQLDDKATWALAMAGFEVAVETNGTRPLPAGIDWICVSPKVGTELAVTAGDELKLVYPQPGAEPERYEHLGFRSFRLQPMDGPDLAANTAATVAYCLAHPCWHLSLQTHKLIGVR